LDWTQLHVLGLDEGSCEDLQCAQQFFVSQKRGHKFPLVLCHRDYFFSFAWLCSSLVAKIRPTIYGSEFDMERDEEA
jgi:hypothetical protein